MKTIKITAEEQRILSEVVSIHNVCRLACFYEYKTDMCHKCKLPQIVYDLYKKVEGQNEKEK